MLLAGAMSRVSSGGATLMNQWDGAQRKLEQRYK
jgi:hypothetical protein